MPKGQAINLYRDYLAYDNTTFQTKYGVEKSVFDENMFFVTEILQQTVQESWSNRSFT